MVHRQCRLQDTYRIIHMVTHLLVLIPPLTAHHCPLIPMQGGLTCPTRIHILPYLLHLRQRRLLKTVIRDRHHLGEKVGVLDLQRPPRARLMVKGRERRSMSLTWIILVPMLWRSISYQWISQRGAQTGKGRQMRRDQDARLLKTQ